MKFHHIGIACKEIEKGKKLINLLFNVKEITECVYDELQNATLCLVILEEGVIMELVSGRVVDSFLKKRQYLYHTCFVTSNMEKDLEEIVRTGGVLISEPKMATLFKKRVAFLMTDLGILELLEE